MIIEVVHGFYRRIRQDQTLGPIFERVIADGWDSHLSKMCDFWSSVLLMSGRFHGTPMAAHLKIDGLGPQHFALWLRMFRETVTELCQSRGSGFVCRQIENDRAEPPDRHRQSSRSIFKFQTDPGH